MTARPDSFDPVGDPLRSMLDVIEQSVRRAFVEARVERPIPYPIAVSRSGAARLMSVSVATVDQWIRTGRVHMVETDNRRSVIATWSLFKLAGIDPASVGLVLVDDVDPDDDSQEEDPPAA